MSLEQRKRGLTDPTMAAVILAAIPDHKLDTQTRMSYYVTPRWKRLSEYEILTCYTQPNPDWIAGGLDWGDWTQKFHGGRPSWGSELTELRSTDWHQHRDPARRWHAPYVKAKAEEWGYTNRFLEGYSAEGSIRTMDPFWRDEMIGKHYGALLHYEYGLFNAHSSVGRDLLGDTMRSTAMFAAFDKGDVAQMIQLEKVFIAKLVPDFDESTEASKALWTKDPIYSAARETVEQVWQSIQDHHEILWSVHAVIDPIFGQYVRREFFQRVAPYYGDNLTPMFIGQAQTYFQTTKAAIQDLYLTCLADDPEFADHNRKYIKAWTAKWLEKTVASLTNFMDIYSKIDVIPGVTDKASVQEAVRRVFNDWVQDYASALDIKVDVEHYVATITRNLKG
jgi:methane monooxygenase component A beta chain